MIKSAGIVLYEPNHDRLYKSLKSLVPQSDLVIIIDNSQNILDFSAFIGIDRDRIIYIKNPTNLGLAKSLSQICDLARDYNVKWLLTLDQDSVISDDFYINNFKYVNIENVAMLCPRVIEDRFNIVQKHKKLIKLSNSGIFEVESAITSGSYIDLSVQQDIGFFEDLFIDGIDNDYSFRLRENGHKILYVTENSILHEFGESEHTILSKLSRYLLGEINPSLIRRNHSTLRIYFQARNTTILNRRWKDEANFFSKIIIIKNFFSLALKIVLVEREKMAKLKEFTRGIYDGLKYEFEVKDL